MATPGGRVVGRVTAAGGVSSKDSVLLRSSDAASRPVVLARAGLPGGAARKSRLSFNVFFTFLPLSGVLGAAGASAELGTSRSS